MPARPGFTPVFQRLRSLIAPCAPRLDVVRDTADHYYLDTRQDKRPIMFAAVRIWKGYESWRKIGRTE